MRELVERLRKRPTPRAGVINQLRAIASWSGVSRLAHITAPTVVIHGTDDPLIPVGNGMRLAQLITDATYVELPGVGHIVPFEAPDALLAAIGSPLTTTAVRPNRSTHQARQQSVTVRPTATRPRRHENPPAD